MFGTGARAETTLTTERLVLTPLRQADAADMAAVLGDPELHAFIGGRPATQAELHDRYGRLVAGSPDPDETWLNWIVRRRTGHSPIGTVQATVMRGSDGWTANVAWVVGLPWQGQGFASEAARALVAWLRSEGVTLISASIHPDHHASASVAARAGLTPTDEEVDGERVWRSGSP
jgi:RimJ/RimL family protein N-acetyltransferase